MDEGWTQVLRGGKKGRKPASSPPPLRAAHGAPSSPESPESAPALPKVAGDAAPTHQFEALSLASHADIKTQIKQSSALSNTRSRSPRLLRDRLLNDGKLLFVDCEMTGLNLSSDVLIEVAALVTNEQLKVLDEGVQLVIRTEKAKLDGMDEWCTEHHTASGLVERCLSAELDMAAAEDRLVQYTSRHFPDGRALLAGSSVHVDKAFIAKDMPRWHAQMTYRVLDVSTVRELVARWYPSATERPNRGEVAHRALSDIQSSIADLRHFRSQAFR